MDQEAASSAGPRPYHCQRWCAVDDYDRARLLGHLVVFGTCGWYLRCWLFHMKLSWLFCAHLTPVAAALPCWWQPPCASSSSTSQRHQPCRRACICWAEAYQYV